jgi:MarR family transcriptional regulator, organic hydroperoxide resistance regulator
MERAIDLQEIQLDNDAADLEAITIRMGWVTRRRLERELEAYNLTVPQYIALRCILESSEGCNMSELAELSRQVSATMTGIIDRLAERGLVQRERDPHDRRSLRVVLTSEGKHLMQQIREHKRAWMRAFLATVNPEERRLMIDMAERYLKVIESFQTPNNDLSI